MTDPWYMLMVLVTYNKAIYMPMKLYLYISVVYGGVSKFNLRVGGIIAGVLLECE
jgi:hypothetical protein